MNGVEPDDRFWADVAIPPDVLTGCWRWTGKLDSKGYGTFGKGLAGAVRRAHRHAWLLFRGEGPGCLFVCHACDNRACVNPNHLFLGSNDDNVADMMRKGRVARGSKCARAKLSEADVEGIHRELMDGAPIKVLAAKYRISAAAIYGIRSGAAWSHLTGRAKRLAASRRGREQWNT